MRIRRSPILTGALLMILSSGSAAAQSPEPEKRPALSVREVVERFGRAVVMIEAESEAQAWQGSGFVVGAGGTIVTNLHVLENASKVKVLFSNGTHIDEVTVSAFDVERDLAVFAVDIRSDMTQLPAVDLGHASSVKPGDRILVISNPMGLEQTVTEGIVSAWREPKKQTTQLQLPSARLIQVSAAISPGSSGAPVFNDVGEVIGVAVGGLMYGMADLNFAVPVDALTALLEDDDALDLERFSDQVGHARFELARPHLDTALMAYERGDRLTAKDEVERALTLCPRCSEGLLLSGRMALEDGELELAEQRLVEAVEVDENNAESWYWLGNLHDTVAIERNSTGSSSDAVAAYEKALELDYHHARAALGLANIRFTQGALDRAEQLLLSAIDSDPRMVNAHYLLGEIHLYRGDLNQAREAFELALWEDDSHALSHFGLAKYYTIAERGTFGRPTQHGSARHHWEEFMRLSEGDPSLEGARQIAIRILERYFPYLLDR